ncbi:MAG: tRNA dihydrouridine synthase DusB [Spirochaetaceae bacterium]|nr:tRNA dihydrouridine synthase DusB [Spirochaetaceae bacterium]
MTGYFRSVDIGNLHLEGNVFAAPMSGYTDRVTRGLALFEGAVLAYTEMISAEALIRNSGRTLSMMNRADGEAFLAVQLFGSSPETLGRAAVLATQSGADLLDLNAGCPVSKVTGKGAGAALGREVERLALAVEEMGKAGLPVTVKIRSGWDEGKINWSEAGHAVVEAGAAAIGFHPRTRRQGYGGRADWTALKKMSLELPVPIIGSGDLDSPLSVLRMFEETGCRAVMIARGAIGNPGIYSQTRKLLTTGILETPPTPEEHLRVARFHLNAAAEEFGDEITAREIKKHLVGYIKGWPSAAELRRELMMASDIPTLMTLLNEES